MKYILDAFNIFGSKKKKNVKRLRAVKSVRCKECFIKVKINFTQTKNPDKSTPTHSMHA